MSTELKQYGLDKIYTDLEPTDDNIIEILKDSLTTFENNSNFIKELIDIYKGKQSILEHTNVTTNVNERNVVNYIKFCIKTITSIILSSPIVYTIEKHSDKFKKDIETISQYIQNAGEHKTNKELVEDMLMTGVGYRYTIPKTRKGKGNVKPSYFSIGRFAPENTCDVFSNDLDNPVVMTFHRATIKRKEKNGDNTEIKRYTCFTDTKKYIIEESKDNKSGYEIVDKNAHGLPFNPVSAVENDIFRLSLTADLIGLQDSLNMAISNVSNDVIAKINQILVIVGAVLDENQKRDLKELGILLLPKGEAGNNPSAEFISSQLDSYVLEFTSIIKKMLFELAGVPNNESGSRAETGVAVQTQSGYVLANFSSSAIELQLEPALRNQLDNIITILKNEKKITSDISASDIDIKFDKNRLSSITELVNNLEALIRLGMNAYDALTIVKLAENNRHIADGIQATLDKRMSIELLKTFSEKSVSEIITIIEQLNKIGEKD